MKKAWLFLSALISLGTFGQGVIIPDLPRRPPVHRVMPMPLQVRHLGIDVQIEGATALTSVDQVFYNPGHRMEEGSYLFPLPKGAHIESFTMFINGVETQAELLDAKKAASIYGEIVRKMKDPALLEYVGGSLFKARIFPIEARSEKRIKLSYRQVVTPDENLHRYVYPLRAARFASSRINSFAFSAHIVTPDPLKTLYSPTHQFHVHRDGKHKAAMSLESQNYTPDRDVEILYAPDRSSLGMQALAHASGKNRFFWLSITPDIQSEKVAAKNLTLVIDTSGSMSGKKMEQAQNALRFCIENLNEEDRFEIIRFSTEAESLAGKLLPATRENRKRAIAFINQLQAIGGTNIEDALNMALALPQDPSRPEMIALITDGKPTIGMREEDLLVGKASEEQGSRRIFTFGIGTEINVHLLDKLAEKTGGWRTYATPDEDIELKLSSFYRKIQSPVLSNTRLTVSGVRVNATNPNPFPDLFLGSPLNVFGRFEGSGKATITLEGDLNGKRKRYDYAFRFPKKESSNAFIPRLWAQRRVGFLLDRIRLHGKEPELVEEVVALAKKYGIVTPFTSYLILEDSPLAQSPAVIHPTRKDRDVLEKKYEGMKQKSGYAGVSASESIQDMASADYLATQPLEKEEADEQGHGQIRVQQAGGRAFYLTDGEWLDASLEGSHSMPEHHLEFGSDAYFKLLKDFPKLGPILALGQKIRFLHGGELYIIQ